MNITLYRLTMVILCVAGIFFTGNTADAQGLTVAIAAESQVTGQYYTLGDIASIYGDDGGRIAGLQQIKLGRVPAPGQSYILNAEILGARLANSQLDLSGITWQIPVQFKVTALSQTISAQQLVGAAEKYLTTRLIGADVLVTALGQPQDLLVPPGDITYDIELPYGVKYNSPTYVTIGVWVAGQPVTVVKLRFDIKKYEQIAVSSRAIAAGELVNADSVVLERRESGRLAPGYVTDLTKILGLTVKRQVAAGMVLNDSLLDKPALIQRGNNVSIVAKIGGIIITTPGIAMENGSENQFIRVRNANSKKIVTGRVIDENTVQIHF